MKNEDIANEFAKEFQSFYKTKIAVSVDGCKMLVKSSGKKTIKSIAHDISLACAIAKRNVDFSVEYNHTYQLIVNFK